MSSQQVLTDFARTCPRDVNAYNYDVVNDDAPPQSMLIRNRINNEIKEVKRNYFTNNLDLHKGDMKKTWQLINELSSKNIGKTNRVSELNFNNQEITAPMDIAEAFNDYFSSVGDNLAASIPTPA